VKPVKRKEDIDEIRNNAKALDDAIEKHNIEEILSYFSDDCEIELLGIKLRGKNGLNKAINWIYEHLKEIILVPITIMIDGNVFFEEFTVEAKAKDGKVIQVKQAEVLVYDDNFKVKSLRLYFDRMELAHALNVNPIDKYLIGKMVKASLKGLL